MLSDGVLTLINCEIKRWPFLGLYFKLFCRGKLSILIYHRVHADIDPLWPDEVDAQTFDCQMELISKNFNVIPLRLAVDLLNRGELPERSLCITFDDGYSDNATVALPIIKKYHLTATFFIATKYIDGGLMWNDMVIEAIRRMPNGELDLTKHGLGKFELYSLGDKRDCIGEIINNIKHLEVKNRQKIAESLVNICPVELPSNLMMNRDQVKLLFDSGMDIGGHTVTHPILLKLNLADAKNEIQQGKLDLEGIINNTITLFAYPNGKPDQDYSSEHVKLVKEVGFHAAVSTQWGVSTQETDRYQLRRFTPWDKSPAKFLLRLLKNYSN